MRSLQFASRQEIDHDPLVGTDLRRPPSKNTLTCSLIWSEEECEEWKGGALGLGEQPFGKGCKYECRGLRVRHLRPHGSKWARYLWKLHQNHPSSWWRHSLYHTTFSPKRASSTLVVPDRNRAPFVPVSDTWFNLPPRIPFSCLDAVVSRTSHCPAILSKTHLVTAPESSKREACMGLVTVGYRLSGEEKP